jgi:hypothetical protein
VRRAGRHLSRLAVRMISAMVVILPLAMWSRPHTASSSGTSTGVPQLITFEDLASGTPVYNQYPGVTFIYGDAPYHPVKVVQPAAGTISPSNALQSQVFCEICGTNMYIDFAIPQHHVGFSTGLAPGLYNGIASYAVELAGYQGSFESPGALVTESFTPCLGNAATPITTPLSIDDSSISIGYVIISLVACDHTSAGDAQPLLLDNFLYDRPLNPPPADHTPPVITITDPSNGATVDGNTPGETATLVTATVTEDALYSLTA